MAELKASEFFSSAAPVEVEQAVQEQEVPRETESDKKKASTAEPVAKTEPKKKKKTKSVEPVQKTEPVI
jgi:hypothetical protein